MNKQECKRVLLILFGAGLYALAVTWFLLPLKLYTGGIVGLAQLLRTLLCPNARFDAAGLINLLLNLPLLALAWRTMSRRMLTGTVLAVAVQTVIFSLAPVPAAPILDDKLAGILLAGVLGGAGCGIILSNGGSAGGLDLLGIYLLKKKNMSVGALNILFNCVLYTVMALLFDLGTAVYSVLFTVAFSLTIDRFHYQNIAVELLIFTHEPRVKRDIMDSFTRGVTAWNGYGAYTANGMEILVTVVAKSEAADVKSHIKALDPDAFIIVHNGVQVMGGYEKRLL